MDAKKRQELVKTLNAPKNFDSHLKERNRIWFLDKIIGSLEADGLDDAAIAQRTREITLQTKAVVRANCDFKLALSASGNARYTARALDSWRRHRVQILYGAIGLNREFAEPANLRYLLLIARRRFRGACRMYFWVNPNSQGYFRYPDRCRADPHWRVNENAEPFWVPLDPRHDTPIKLRPQASGQVDPVTALTKLFIAKDACKGNLLDCSTVASIIFMDSLLEAKEPRRLLGQLVAAKGDEYFIIHQLSRAGDTNFAEDTTDTGLMQRLGRAPADLQVGDHVYIFNHPLYLTFRPTGPWRGEHSFVYVTGDRDFKSQQGYVFGGHGKTGTLYQFYDERLGELKSDLSLARQIMLVHLAFLRDSAPAVAPGTVTEEEHPVGIAGKPAIPYRLLQYDKNVLAKDYTKIPTKTRKRPRASAPAFVVAQSKTENLFYLDQIEKPDRDEPLDKNLKKTIAEITATGKLAYPICFRRTEEPPAGAPPDVVYDKASWAVTYLDLSTGKEEPWFFFEKQKDGTLQRKELTLEDLFRSPFGLFTKAGTDLEVRQPTVDFGAGHQDFLTANGGF